jgi:phosphoribosyl 1,2-cyclic phosphodiesterase
MLKIQPLASGSKGNCTYIASDDCGILVDIGLNLTDTLRRMEDANIDPKSVGAILITHEHSDHIKGVAAFVRKFKPRIYMPDNAMKVFKQFIGEFPTELLSTFNGRVDIGDIAVDCFPVPHDSKFCFGYAFTKGDCKISLATDLGQASRETIGKMSNSQIVMLECNHDMLKLHNNAKYPAWLKRRISGSFGHLSNSACSLAVYELVKLGVQQVILAHLSEENNTPTLAYSVVRDFLTAKGIAEGVDIAIDIAHQHKVGTVYQID